MARKISFDLDKAVSRVAKPSVFDRLVREIDCIQIPPRYIQTVLIQYNDGSVVEVEGGDLKYSIPMHKDAKWEKVDEVFRDMKDLKVFIDTETLEKDVNLMVEDFLGKYC